MFLTLLFLVAGCRHDSYNGALKKKNLVPFIATDIGGDDGVDTLTLTISENNNRFSAREIMADNFSNPRIFDTLTVKNLTAAQIAKARAFLITASELQSSCKATGPFPGELTISCNGNVVEIKGSCDWKDNDYNALHRALFNKD